MVDELRARRKTIWQRIAGMPPRLDKPRAGEPCCPQCEAEDHVEPSGVHASPWWCTACNLAFDGTTGEFLGMYERRKAHQARIDSERAGQPPIPPLHLPASYHPKEVG